MFLTKSRTKMVALIYGFWVILLAGATSYGEYFAFSSEYGLSAFLWLNFTGAPSAFLSWLLPSQGSLLTVIVAGVAGLLQWCVIVKFTTKDQENGAS